MNLFIKIENEVPIGYPLVESNLRHLFPNLTTGYLQDDILKPLGYARYIMTAKPISEDLTKEFVEKAIIKNNDGVFVQTWAEQDKVFTSAADKDVAIKDTFKIRMSKLRDKRNELLAQTDKYALQDVTMDEEVVAYRQALRDLPSIVDLGNPEFPEVPVGLDLLESVLVDLTPEEITQRETDRIGAEIWQQH